MKKKVSILEQRYSAIMKYKKKKPKATPQQIQDALDISGRDYSNALYYIKNRKTLNKKPRVTVSSKKKEKEVVLLKTIKTLALQLKKAKTTLASLRKV